MQCNLPGDGLKTSVSVGVAQLSLVNESTETVAAMTRAQDDTMKFILE